MNKAYQMRVRREREKARAEREAMREARVLLAEPIIRAYEAAYEEANPGDKPPRLHYRKGWVMMESPGGVYKYRLSQIEGMTRVLEERAIERAMTLD